MTNTQTAWQHSCLRVQRLIRSILEASREREARPVMQTTLVKALGEKEKIRRVGWFS